MSYLTNSNFFLVSPNVLLLTYMYTCCIFQPVIGADTNTKAGHRHGHILLGEGQPLETVVSKFPYYVSGYDNEDRPILVLEWGKWDIRSVAEKGGKELADFEKSLDVFVDLVRAGFYDRKVNGSDSPLTHAEFVPFGDWDGLDLRQIASTRSVALFVQMLSKFSLLYGEFSYGFIVNANPLAKQVLFLAKPFVGKFLERTDIYGNNRRQWIPSILKKLPRDQLHPAYGGPTDFRPVAVYSYI